MSMPISQEMLRKILDYDPETGFLTWKHRPLEMFADSGRQSQKQNAAAWNGKNAGRRAFMNLTSGYHVGGIFWRDYRAHRVIWAWWYGEWPASHIDHINHIRTDNRIANLRLADDQTNMKNQSLRGDNRSGVTGVFWQSRISKWQATIRADGKTRHLGYFKERDAAAKARKVAEEKYGYHPNHGRMP